MPAYKDKDPDIVCPFYKTQTRQTFCGAKMDGGKQNA